ncbi:MAG: hypothetical protein L3J70_07000 [Gammaproteobacteria bacterium]|nr:hypothetical protein [Gammaproteobacteria bacterium]
MSVDYGSNSIIKHINRYKQKLTLQLKMPNMKDRFRYALLRPYGNEKLVSQSKRYLTYMAIFAFLIATLGSVASGFIVWLWLPVQFELFSLGTILVVFIILWLLSTKIITYDLPEPLTTIQKLRALFLTPHGKIFNGCFWTLVIYFIVITPTLFTLTLLPAIDQFNQQQFSHEKELKLQKSGSDYSHPLKLINKDIEEERNSFDLLVNEEEGDDIDNIDLTIKSLEHLEEEKFYLLQEFSQEDAQLKQLTLVSPRSLFNLSLPTQISSTQKHFLESQAHWKYSALKLFCFFLPLSTIIALLAFKLFQPIPVSHYLNQRLRPEIESKITSTPTHKTINNESALSATSLLRSNNKKPSTLQKPSVQQETTQEDKITYLKKKRVVVLSDIESLEGLLNAKNITKERFIQKRNILEKNSQTLSEKILKMLLENAKTVLATHDNDKNNTKDKKKSKKLLNA